MIIAEVQDLVKKYPSFELKSISFHLESGRITGFIGRNGAGKTTTIKSMLNMIHPDSGTIRYFGRPIAGNEADIKKRIGYSTGTVSWYPRKKIRDIVNIVKRFYDTWDEAAYRKYLDLFGIDEKKTPLELSEGMKVKVNLMLALAHRSDVLILDKVFQGDLNAPTMEKVWRLQNGGYCLDLASYLTPYKNGQKTWDFSIPLSIMTVSCASVPSSSKKAKAVCQA